MKVECERLPARRCVIDEAVKSGGHVTPVTSFTAEESDEIESDD